MIGTPRNVSLDELVAEVQQIEEILYRRAKNQRLLNQFKQSSTPDDEQVFRKYYNDNYTRQTMSRLNNEQTWYMRPKAHQVNEVMPRRYPNNGNHTTVQPISVQQSYSSKCYNCGGDGHWARNCPVQQGAYRQERGKPNRKNSDGALDERTSHAPM